MSYKDLNVFWYVENFSQYFRTELEKSALIGEKLLLELKKDVVSNFDRITAEGKDEGQLELKLVECLHEAMDVFREFCRGVNASLGELAVPPSLFATYMQSILREGSEGLGLDRDIETIIAFI